MTGSDELCWVPAIDLAQMIRNGDVTPTDVWCQRHVVQRLRGLAGKTNHSALVASVNGQASLGWH